MERIIRPRRDLPADIAQAIRAARNARGWSLRVAARHTGISLSMLYRLEAGTRVPSVALAAHLADAFDMDPETAERLAQVAVPDRGRSGVYALGTRRSLGQRPTGK